MALSACSDDASKTPSADAANADGNTFIPDGGTRIDTAPDGASSDGPAGDSADTHQGADGAIATEPMVRVWSASSGVLPQGDCPPWELLDDAEPENVVIENGSFVLETSADPERLFYSQATPWVLTPAVLKIEARIKVVTSWTSTPARASTSFGFTIGPAHLKNILFLETDGVFLLSGENVRGPEVKVNTTDDFHTYRIEAHPITGVVTVFRDDLQILSGAAFKDPDFTKQRVFWGEGSTLARGRSEWKYLNHNAADVSGCR